MEDIKIVYRELSELVEPDYNPRKINAKQKNDIRKSLTEFGFVQPLVINTYEGRENIIIGGNQRKRIAELIGLETAPCIEVSLDFEKEKELNLRLNKNQAEFDVTLLNEYFEKDFLYNVGFSIKEVGAIESEFDKKFKGIDTLNSVYPIVPKFDEKYDYVMIFCKSEMDFTWLRNTLNVERKKDYKNNNLGECRVIDVKEFQKLVEEWKK